MYFSELPVGLMKSRNVHWLKESNLKIIGHWIFDNASISRLYTSHIFVSQSFAYNR